MSEESDAEVGLVSVHELLRINLKKADPILRLLSAQRGFEDGQVPFLDAWSVFKVFMKLPTIVADGGGTFQATHAEADPEVLEVFFGRQLTEDSELGWSETRVIGFSFVFHPLDSDSGDIDDPEWDEDEEIWSADFVTVEEFFAAVEESAGFRSASSRELLAVTFYSQEHTPDEE